MKKKVHKIFPGFERRNEKRFLEGMFQKGYKLVNINRNVYYFEEVEPQEVIYEFDFQMLKKDEQEEYLSFKSHWIFAANRSEYYWFYIPKEEYTKDLEFFNNNETKAKFYKKQLNVFVIIAVLLFLSSVVCFVQSYIIFQYFGYLSVILFILYSYDAIKYYVRYKKIKSDIIE